MANSTSADVVVVGNEGIVGIALFMGGATMPNRAVVQSAGDAYRLKGPMLKRELDRFGGRLQKAGLIHYSRVRITVLDRPGLEARVCECYEVVRKEFQRLLPEESGR